MLRIDPSNNAAMLKQLYDTDLRQQTRTADVLSELEGNYRESNGKGNMLSKEVVMRVDLAGGAFKKTIGLIQDLSGAGVEGRTEQIGAEENQAVKYAQVFSNDFSHAVRCEKYGIDAHTKAAWGLIAQIQPQLANWRKARIGRYMREAILERYSSNLTTAPTSLTQEWNENIFVKNVSVDSQPAYSATLATYTEALGDALESAGTTSAAYIDVDFLENAEEYFKYTKPLETLPDGMLIMTIPSRSATLLKRSSSSESLPGLFKESTGAVIEKYGKNIAKNYLGTFGCWILVEDPRAAVLDKTGSDGSWALTAYYADAGVDYRTGTSGNVYDVCNVLGRNGLVHTVHEEVHMEDEETNYKKIASVGAFAGEAYQTLVYDVASETDSSRRNQNSGVCLVKRGTYTA